MIRKKKYIINIYYYLYRTDVLKRYLGKELKLILPDNKKLTEINWFAIYDLSKNVRNSIYILFQLHTILFICTYINL